eukprot:TRINITY_DN9479_c0_g4_i1.p1 TRINITY_DN9479_c0_g4~~TRINITY_DN9479_c0_g4_i1.p1  ORF type:complete len:1108 (+),score=159.52 TRINITY_DN9479_c0_g4_i1:3-3326(+)
MSFELSNHSAAATAMACCPTAEDQPAGGSYAKYIEAYGSDEGGIVKYAFMKRYTKRPCLCFVQACAVHWVLFVLFIALNSLVGTKYMALSTSDFGLHLWEDDYKIRVDAVSEGAKTCRFDPLVANTVIAQQEGSELYEVGRYGIDIVYKAKSGNMLTVSNLEKVKELEDYITNHPDYAKFCRRVPGQKTCLPAKSVIMACHPDSSAPTPSCLHPKSQPPGIVDCTNKEGCPRSQWSLNETFTTLKLRDYASAQFGRDWPETNFLHRVDASFGGGSQVAVATRTSFEFGFPLEGFDALNDRPKKQQEKVEAFFAKLFSDKLFSYNADNPNLGYNIGFSGGNLFQLSFMTTLAGDAQFLFLAFLVVFLYVMFMTGSLFLAVISMLQIFACFFSGFHMYRLLFGNPYLGIFHVQAIFLLVGVGVDDVFVFLDHFEAAARADPTHKTNLWARLSWTWKYSATAMGVTSLTTAVSFFMNGLSGLPGMASFGIFAGSMVVMMYISMVLYFPAVVCFNQRYFKHQEFCCGVNRICSKKNNTTDSPDKSEEKPALVRFFEDHFSHFILNHRLKILVVSFAAIGTHLGINLPQLIPEKSSPPALPSNHPIQILINAYKEDFIRGGGSQNTEINLVFGFDAKKPLNREGTDKLGINFGEGSSSQGAGGTINWNSRFSTVDDRGDNLNLLLAWPCWVQLCTSAEVANSDRNAGGAPAYKMDGCWPRDFQATANLMDKERGNPEGTLWTQLTGPSPGRAFSEVFARAVQDKDADWMLNDVLPYVFGEKGDHKNEDGQYMPRWKWAITSMKLTSTASIGSSKGMELMKKWEDWLTDEMSKGVCRQEVTSNGETFKRGDILTPFISSDGFARFRMTDKLMSEMVQGLAVSVAVALVVLVLVTGNIITGSIAAFTIALIVVCVLGMVPVMGWELGVSQVIGLIMVPGLSVDFTAHLAEAYMGAKYDDREHRVIHALEHSGVSVVSGAVSTLLASGCLLFCTISFFKTFGTMIFITIIFAIVFSVFFFPALMAMIGPVGEFGDWHHLISPKLKREYHGEKQLRVVARRSTRDLEAIETKEAQANAVQPAQEQEAPQPQVAAPEQQKPQVPKAAATFPDEELTL